MSEPAGVRCEAPEGGSAGARRNAVSAARAEVSMASCRKRATYSAASVRPEKSSAWVVVARPWFTSSSTLRPPRKSRFVVTRTMSS